MSDETEGAAGFALGDPVGHVAQLLAVGQTRRAREAAVRLVAEAPDEPSAQLVLSQVLATLKELEPAQAAADEAVRLAPDAGAAHAQRARVLLQRGRFAPAERAVAEALALDPSEPSTHLLRAHLLLVCDRAAAALDAVEHALRLDPDDPDAHRLRAVTLLKTAPRDWDISEHSARRAVELDPDDADAHGVLGFVHLHAHRLDDAEERFRAALTLDPNNVLALHGLSEALMARSPLYRPFLKVSLFLQGAGPGVQLAAIAGLWALVNAAVPMLRGAPPPFPAAAGPLQGAYLVLCAYTWFVTPATRFVLARRYPWLRGVGD
jgi:tetratricopeptide (TPR) repeat protein